jgi:hypothetical protein
MHRRAGDQIRCLCALAMSSHSAKVWLVHGDPGSDGAYNTPAEKLRQHGLVAGTLTVFSTPTDTEKTGRNMLVRGQQCLSLCRLIHSIWFKRHSAVLKPYGRRDR